MPLETRRPELRLELRSVSKFFGDCAALKEVSLEVEPGNVLFLYGANGAGKTTLLRIMASLSRPTSGQVLWGNEDIRNRPREAKSGIGFASHSTLLYNDLTVRENLEFYGKLFGVADLKARVDGELARFNLRDREKVLTRDLSRGLQQRVSLARTLLHDPIVVLLDEPFTGLDWRSTEKLESLLRELPQQGKAVVFSTHNFQQGAALAGRLVALERGRIRYNGPMEGAPFENLGIPSGAEALHA